MSRPVSKNPPIGAAAAEYAWDPGAVPPPPRPPRSQPPAAPGPAGEIHRWERVNGSYICTLCRTRAKNQAQYFKRLDERCPGYCAGLAEIAQHPRGHQLLLFEYAVNSSTMILCRSCGSYAETGTRGRLFQECPREPKTNNAKTQLSRALVLRHPRCGLGSEPVFKPPVPLEQFYREAIEAAQEDSIGVGPQAGYRTFSAGPFTAPSAE